ncbi:hypothetical protein SKAU_G00095810 [Synaphobranchus kaupii]|uniref:Gypsy retrotransposon integrase-like protein 1 n=1 Tax=Synaphobranchus kaupii TaxID=118154 RepID=A0A9Q1FYF4_SYNKA|nr:hypothetical protein SKAU_G00095810 [Synaphobranchus kaupii]
MKPSVKFLGHIMSKNGVSTDPEKVRAMVDVTEQDLMEHGTDIPSPSKIKSFLGMVVFYQQYIKGCSRIGKPLFDLISGMKKPRYGRGRKKPKVDRQLTSADWTPACSEAFSLLKQALLEKVTLAHPDFTKPFLLSVDASSNGLGAVLSQPSVFHRLTGVPRGALLEDAKALNTDCVQDVFRWSCHPFDMGKRGHPGAGPSTDTVAANCTAVIGFQGPYVTPQEVSAVLSWCQSQDEYVWPHAYLLPQLTQSLQPSPQSGVHSLSRQELIEMQRADTCLSRKHHLKKEVPPVCGSRCLEGESAPGCPCHQGQQRTLSLARQRFYWHGLDKDVKEYVRCCKRCVFSKSPEPEARAPLKSIVTSRPLELVCIDFWSAEDSSNKSVDVLVVTDHFTKLAQAYPCSNQSAKVVARQLWNNFCTYGFPERVHSDQGANFESSLIAEMLQVAGVQKSHTTPYHPMGNGCIERFNRTLGNMIRALLPKAKHRWLQMLKALTFSYNATVHETTGYAPFQLMFGRCPRLPIDMMFESVLQDERVAGYDVYVQALKRDLAEAVKIAQASASKQQKRQANLYDKKLKGAPVDVGDRLLLANKGKRGKRKLADRWEGHLYVVTEKTKGVHTFKIRNSETGVEKVVHRNLIMPVNFLPVQDGSEADSGETDIANNVDNPRENVVEVDSVAATVRDYDDRTVMWVSELPVPGEDQSDASDDVHSMDGTMTDRDTDIDVSSSVAADTACTTDPTPLTLPHINTQHSSSTSHSLCVGPSQGSIVPLAGARALDFYTRCGRVVRPVRRLIESMPMNVFVGK